MVFGAFHLGKDDVLGLFLGGSLDDGFAENGVGVGDAEFWHGEKLGKE